MNWITIAIVYVCIAEIVCFLVAPGLLERLWRQQAGLRPIPMRLIVGGMLLVMLLAPIEFAIGIGLIIAMPIRALIKNQTAREMFEDIDRMSHH